MVLKRMPKLRFKIINRERYIENHKLPFFAFRF
jgi:hypothetical protein